MSYPTPEGKILGGLCRSFMVQSTVQTATIDLSGIPFYNCFSDNDEFTISARVPNLLAQYALGKAMSVYVNTYFGTDLIHTGTVAPGTWTLVGVNEENAFSPGGKPELPPLTAWMAYSFPAMFGDFNEKDYIDAIDSMFKRFGMWLATPSIFKVGGICKSVVMGGVGVISWKGWIGATGDGIKDKIKAALKELFSNTPEDPIKTYELSWDIIGSGIAEMLSYNEVVTIDAGVALTNQPVGVACIPIPVPYTGGSVGKLGIFKEGDSVFQHAAIGFNIPFPIIGPLDITFSLKLPHITLPKLRIKDKFGQFRELSFELDFSKVLNLITFVKDIELIFTNLIDEVILTLLNMCFDFDMVLELTLNYQKELINITVPELNASFLKAWTDNIAILGDELITMAWQNVAAPLWSAFLATVMAIEVGTPLPGLTTLTNTYALVDGTIKGINDVVASITKLPVAFEKAVDPIVEVIDLIGSIDFSKYINICDEFKLPPLPVVPTLPPMPPLPVPPPIVLPIPVELPFNPYDATLPPPDSATGLIGAIVDPIISSLVIPSFTLNLSIDVRINEVIQLHSIKPCTA